MSQTMKVNVTFPLEVPVMRDSAGRQRSVPDHVAKYIDEFMKDVRISHLWSKSGWTYEKLSDGASESEMALYEKMTSKKTAESIAESERLAEERKIEFEKFKEEECRRLYNCSWAEFRTMKWPEQEALRELNGVYWKDGRWMKA